MRPRDLVPFVLLGGIIAFLGVEIARRPEPPALAAPPAAPIAAAGADAGADAEPPAGADAPVIPQGAADPALVQVVSAAAPTPPRDENAIRVMLRDGAPGTYIMNILGQQEQWIIRWPEHRGEDLRVWIERASAVGNWDPGYPLAAERAFAEWRAAGFPLAFQFVHDSGSAHVRIRWIDRFGAADGRKIGVAHKQYDQSGWLVRADIELATHDARGNALTAALIAGVARHEIGHALGLGHSGSATDVMFPESRTPVISAADRATLHLLYKLPPGQMR